MSMDNCGDCREVKVEEGIKVINGDGNKKVRKKVLKKERKK